MAKGYVTHYVDGKLVLEPASFDDGIVSINKDYIASWEPAVNGDPSHCGLCQERFDKANFDWRKVFNSGECPIG
jgi:hypothetical protein